MQRNLLNSKRCWPGSFATATNWRLHAQSDTIEHADWWLLNRAHHQWWFSFSFWFESRSGLHFGNTTLKNCFLFGCLHQYSNQASIGSQLFLSVNLQYKTRHNHASIVVGRLRQSATVANYRMLHTYENARKMHPGSVVKWNGRHYLQPSITIIWGLASC